MFPSYRARARKRSPLVQAYAFASIPAFIVVWALGLTGVAIGIAIVNAAILAWPRIERH